MTVRLDPAQHDLAQRVLGHGGSVAASEAGNVLALLRTILGHVQIEREARAAQSPEHEAGQAAADAAVIHLRTERARMGALELGKRSELFDPQAEQDSRSR